MSQREKEGGIAALLHHRAPFQTHFGVSVAMDDHWQRVIKRVPDSDALCSELKKHVVCQEGEKGRTRVLELTDLTPGQKLSALKIA